MITISLLMVFIFDQSKRVVTDYLTGVANRRQFENHIANLKPKQIDKNLAGMLIDLNDFKSINDTYGHVYGDEVLIELAKVLKTTFTANDFIARTGGDEFVILFKVKKTRSVATATRNLIENVNVFNASGRFPFDVKFSYGVLLFDAAKYSSIADFIAQIDQLMYRQKRQTGQQGSEFPLR